MVNSFLRTVFSFTSLLTKWAWEKPSVSVFALLLIHAAAAVVSWLAVTSCFCHNLIPTVARVFFFSKDASWSVGQLVVLKTIRIGAFQGGSLTIHFWNLLVPVPFKRTDRWLGWRCSGYSDRRERQPLWQKTCSSAPDFIICSTDTHGSLRNHMAPHNIWWSPRLGSVLFELSRVALTQQNAGDDSELSCWASASCFRRLFNSWQQRTLPGAETGNTVGAQIN